jgi:hypothetical protein
MPPRGFSGASSGVLPFLTSGNTLLKVEFTIAYMISQNDFRRTGFDAWA